MTDEDRTKKVPAKKGRPTKYTTDMPARAYDLCSTCGLTIKKLAVAFGVAESQIKEWMKAYPDFQAAIKSGRDDWDSLAVEKCLLKRAMGYTYTEITREPVITKAEDGMSLEELRVTKRVKKHVPPDVGAQCFWLKNRQPGRWKDRQEIAVEHPDLTIYFRALNITASEVWPEAETEGQENGRAELCHQGAGVGATE